MFIKVLTNNSKLRNENQNYYFTDVTCKTIIKVKTIGKLKYLTNVPLMMKKQIFIWTIIFPNGLNVHEESKF